MQSIKMTEPIQPAETTFIPRHATPLADRAAAVAPNAQDLRDILSSLHPTYFGEHYDAAGLPARPVSALQELVDVREAAPGLVMLPAPSWSEPEQRFLVRPELGERLRRAAHALPSDLRIGFWEGYRPLAVQWALWNTGLDLLRAAQPLIAEAQLEVLLETYVARPDATALHSVGRAVDIAVLNAAGEVFDLETRRGRLAYAIFARALTRSGLDSYDREWWHWSYGPAAVGETPLDSLAVCLDPRRRDVTQILS